MSPKHQPATGGRWQRMRRGRLAAAVAAMLVIGTSALAPVVAGAPAPPGAPTSPCFDTTGNGGCRYIVDWRLTAQRATIIKKLPMVRFAIAPAFGKPPGYFQGGWTSHGSLTLMGCGAQWTGRTDTYLVLRIRIVQGRLTPPANPHDVNEVSLTDETYFNNTNVHSGDQITFCGQEWELTQVASWGLPPRKVAGGVTQLFGGDAVRTELTWDLHGRQAVGRFPSPLAQLWAGRDVTLTGSTGFGGGSYRITMRRVP
jgi:hypothetical protein